MHATFLLCFMPLTASDEGQNSPLLVMRHQGAPESQLRER